ncbi:hypothetical protein AVEN_162836-1 [Araneus ventricosus]|uniref:EFHB C-terminal EF-hand domain-containing protein n=1 Tax=Araneus ventricosus TaxID=182803 RepID=A0A4Y2C658_ARAVE|nr:hypothetical protein AVEN_162836-1 [Araneus ventricosus]
MRKQYFTTQVASLVNPPLLSKYETLQQEMFEKICASKKTPLGRTPHPTVPPKTIKQGFGIITEKGDSAGVLLYPFSCRIFHSVYDDSFKPPNQTSYSDVPAAGVKMEGIDESGTRMKKVFEEIGNVEPTIIAPLTTLQKKNTKNKVLAEKELGCDLSHNENDHCIKSSDQAETCLYSDNLLLALWSLVKNKKSCYRKHFYSYLKSYLQNFSKTFTLNDLQKMFENFDVPVSKHSLKQVLCTFGLVDNSEDINYDKFLKTLKWESVLNETSKAQNSTNLCKSKNAIPPHDITMEQLKTSSSRVGDHKPSVPLKTAGLPSCRSDIQKPKLRSVVDWNEYGDTKSLASIVQPSVFEKYGVYEDDLGTLMPKEEIISILIQSGISFNNKVFNVIWEKVNKRGKASIGEIWSALKYLCLTQNSLFP